MSVSPRHKHSNMSKSLSNEIRLPPTPSPIPRRRGSDPSQSIQRNQNVNFSPLENTINTYDILGNL